MTLLLGYNNSYNNNLTEAEQSLKKWRYIHIYIYYTYIYVYTDLLHVYFQFYESSIKLMRNTSHIRMRAYYVIPSSYSERLNMSTIMISLGYTMYYTTVVTVSSHVYLLSHTSYCSCWPEGVTGSPCCRTYSCHTGDNTQCHTLPSLHTYMYILCIHSTCINVLTHSLYT